LVAERCANVNGLIRVTNIIRPNCLSRYPPLRPPPRSCARFFSPRDVPVSADPAFRFVMLPKITSFLQRTRRTSLASPLLCFDSFGIFNPISHGILPCHKDNFDFFPSPAFSLFLSASVLMTHEKPVPLFLYANFCLADGRDSASSGTVGRLRSAAHAIFPPSTLEHAADCARVNHCLFFRSLRRLVSSNDEIGLNGEIIFWLPWLKEAMRVNDARKSYH